MDIWRKALKKIRLDIWDLGKTGGMWHAVKGKTFVYGHKTKATRTKNLNIHNKTKTIKAYEKKDY